MIYVEFNHHFVFDFVLVIDGNKYLIYFFLF
jgi:hypothetical protein